MTMQLYYCTYENDDGEDLSLFVSAGDPDRAAEVWRDYAIEEEWIEDHEFQGILVKRTPTRRDLDDCVRIFEVHHRTRTVEGVLHWHDTSGGAGGSVKLRGFVRR